MYLGENGLKQLIKRIKEDIKEKLSNYLPLEGGTMKGNIQTMHHIKGGHDGLFDIDFDGEDFEIGIRNSDGTWRNHIRFVTEGEGDAIFIYDEDGYPIVRLKRDGCSIPGFTKSKNSGININSGVHGLNVIGDDHVDISSLYDILSLFAGEDIKLEAVLKLAIETKMDDIRIMPGVEELGKNKAPAPDRFVKTGHIKGVKDQAGNRSSITNFGKINSEVFNVGKYLGLKSVKPADKFGVDTVSGIALSHIDIYDNSGFGDCSGFFSIAPDNQTAMQTGSLYFADGSFEIYPNVKIDYDDENKKVSISRWQNKQDGRVRFSSDCFEPIKRQSSWIYNIGSNYNKIDNIYANTGTIITSDRNEKDNIELISVEKAKAFVLGIKPSSFTYVNSSSSGRTHFGMISQDIEELLEELGWSSLDFAGFIKSPKVEVEEVTDEKGKTKPVEKVIEGEYDYSLRYDEFIAPVIAVVQNHEEVLVQMQQEIESLKVDKAQLEERLAKIETQMGIR